MTNPKKQRVYLSIGSNIDRELHVRAALDALTKEFGQLLISPVYESESVGFTGDNFFNLVVGFDTILEVRELATLMRAVEYANARRRTGVRFGPRTLDIDILTYGDCCVDVDDVELPRDEILKNAFVLIPLADIAGKQRHPVLKKTYRELAEQFDNGQQKLWPVNFVWQGKQISRASGSSR